MSTLSRAPEPSLQNPEADTINTILLAHFAAFIGNKVWEEAGIVLSRGVAKPDRKARKLLNQDVRQALVEPIIACIGITYDIDDSKIRDVFTKMIERRLINQWIQYSNLARLLQSVQIDNPKKLTKDAESTMLAFLKKEIQAFVDIYNRDKKFTTQELKKRGAEPPSEVSQLRGKVRKYFRDCSTVSRFLVAKQNARNGAPAEQHV